MHDVEHDRLLMKIDRRFCLNGDKQCAGWRFEMQQGVAETLAGLGISER